MINNNFLTMFRMPFVFVFFFAFTAAVMGQTMVSIQPDHIKSVGDTIHVPVRLTGDNILNMAFYLDYNHSILVPHTTPYINLHPDFEVAGFNPDWQPGTLGLFIDAIGLDGIDFNGDPVITLVFSLAQSGTTQMVFRNGQVDMPVSGVWDELAAPIVPVTYTGNQITVNPEVPPVREVKNVAVHDGESFCYDATISITVAGNGSTFLVEAGGHAEFVAGSKITFLPGTTVLANGYMHAMISPTGPFCGSAAPAVPSIAALPEERQSETGMEWIVYPNPTNSAVQLNVADQSSMLPVSVKASLFTMHGKLIRSENFRHNSSASISLEDLPSGVYLLQLRWETGQKILKVVKN